MNNKEFRDRYGKENYDIMSYPFGAEEFLLEVEQKEMDNNKKGEEENER